MYKAMNRQGMMLRGVSDVGRLQTRIDTMNILLYRYMKKDAARFATCTGNPPRTETTRTLGAVIKTSLSSEQRGGMSDRHIPFKYISLVAKNNGSRHTNYGHSQDRKAHTGMDPEEWLRLWRYISSELRDAPFDAGSPYMDAYVRTLHTE